MAPSSLALLPGRARRRAARSPRSPARPQQRQLGAGVAELALGRAARTSTGASASARSTLGRAGQQELVVRRPSRPRSSPAGGPWPSRSRRAGRCAGPRARTSLVSWPCRNLAASAPRARITPQSVEPAGALEGMWRWHAPLSSAVMTCVVEGVERSRGRRETMRVWRFAVPAAARRARRGGVCGLVVAASAAAAAPPIRSSCRSSSARRRARSPRPGSGPASRPSRSCSTNGSAGRARRERSAPAATRSARHDADRPAREDGARRRDARRRPLHRRLDLPPGPRRAGARPRR